MGLLQVVRTAALGFSDTMGLGDLKPTAVRDMSLTDVSTLKYFRYALRLKKPGGLSLLLPLPPSASDELRNPPSSR